MSKPLKENVDHKRTSGGKVNSKTVHLNRPWTLSSTVKKIAVLDRTLEDGAVCEPLFLEVNVARSDTQLVTLDGQHQVTTLVFPSLVHSPYLPSNVRRTATTNSWNPFRGRGGGCGPPHSVNTKTCPAHCKTV